MENFVSAIGLVFVIEGLLYVIAPNRMKSMMAVMENAPQETLRNIGVFAVAIGVLIVWMARTWLSS